MSIARCIIFRIKGYTHVYILTNINLINTQVVPGPLNLETLLLISISNYISIFISEIEIKSVLGQVKWPRGCINQKNTHLAAVYKQKPTLPSMDPSSVLWSVSWPGRTIPRKCNSCLIRDPAMKSFISTKSSRVSYMLWGFHESYTWWTKTISNISFLHKVHLLDNQTILYD